MASDEKPPILVMRRGEFLVPVSPIDGERIREFPAGKPLKARLTQPQRSNAQLRLYWSLLNVVCENLDQPMEPEDLHTWLKMRLGLTVEIRQRNGDVFEVPRSVAFDRMEHGEFTKYFDRVKRLLVERVIPGVKSETLEREALAMLGEAA